MPRSDIARSRPNLHASLKAVSSTGMRESAGLPPKTALCHRPNFCRMITGERSSTGLVQ
jgi:hypothetical protein